MRVPAANPTIPLGWSSWGCHAVHVCYILFLSPEEMRYSFTDFWMVGSCMPVEILKKLREHYTLIALGSHWSIRFWNPGRFILNALNAYVYCMHHGCHTFSALILRIVNAPMWRINAMRVHLVVPGKIGVAVKSPFVTRLCSFSVQLVRLCS